MPLSVRFLIPKLTGDLDKWQIILTHFKKDETYLDPDEYVRACEQDEELRHAIILPILNKLNILLHIFVEDTRSQPLIELFIFLKFFFVNELYIRKKLQEKSKNPYDTVPSIYIHDPRSILHIELEILRADHFANETISNWWYLSVNLIEGLYLNFAAAGDSDGAKVQFLDAFNKSGFSQGCMDGRITGGLQALLLTPKISVPPHILTPRSQFQRGLTGLNFFQTYREKSTAMPNQDPPVKPPPILPKGIPLTQGGERLSPRQQGARDRLPLPGSPMPQQWTLVARERWAKDNMVRRCSLCDVDFTLMMRRHHCRYCGNIFCQSCSQFQINGQRTCQSCYQKWNAGEGQY